LKGLRKEMEDGKEENDVRFGDEERRLMEDD
jgi:hypothetical protein